MKNTANFIRFRIKEVKTERKKCKLLKIRNYYDKSQKLTVSFSFALISLRKSVLFIIKLWFIGDFFVKNALISHNFNGKNYARITYSCF